VSNSWEEQSLPPRRGYGSQALPTQLRSKIIWLLLQDLKTSQRIYTPAELEMADLAMVTLKPDGTALVGPGMGS
jgi:hypothetical protein